MAVYIDLQAELIIVSTSQTEHSDSLSQGLVWTEPALSRVKVRKDEKRGEENLDNKKNDHTSNNSMI